MLVSLFNFGYFDCLEIDLAFLNFPAISVFFNYDFGTNFLFCYDSMEYGS